MPRPAKCRRVCHYPKTAAFSPAPVAELRPPVVLTVDEYEAIRLIDAEGFSQEQCSQSMEIARTPVQKIYESARKTLAAMLVEGRPLILGGVTIPFEKGLLGHSDADVLLHAISDALLGAAALGDIGHLFPDTDDRWKGADSLKLLEEVVRVLADRGYQIENIDATLLAQRPKLAPYIDEMRGNIADACRVDIAQVSVKATTEEGLGFTGTGAGMAAHAVALIEKA